jgi:choice-of-anchor A domain-containing protein
MTKKYIFAIGIAAAAFVTGTQVQATTASDYNVLVRGNYTGTNSDTRGWVATGGNITANAGHSIGCDAATASGGSEVCRHPAPNSGLTAIAGGTISGPAGGAILGNSLASGYNYSMSFGNTNGGTAYTYADMTSPIDIDAEFVRLSTLSSDLHANAASYGSVYGDIPMGAYNSFTTDPGIQVAYNQLQLTGTDTGVNIFEISTADWSALSNYATLLLNIPEGAVAILNIGGTALSMPLNSVVVNGVYGTSINAASRILYNFYEATSLTLTNSAFGSILAAGADVTGTTGMLDGQLIANSLSTTGYQINDFAFVDKGLIDKNFGETREAGAVPEPATWAMMLVGFGMVGHTMRQRRRRTTHLVTA